jgi:UDP-glucose 4-epimerase
MAVAKDLGEYFCIPPDLRDLNYGKFIEDGDKKISDAVEYNSHNTKRLSVKEMKSKLFELRIIAHDHQ